MPGVLTEGVDQIVAPSTDVRLPNMKLATGWIALSFVALTIVFLSRNIAQSSAALLTGLFCLQAFINSAAGVQLSNGRLRIPKVLLRFMPLVFVGRRSIDVRDINDITFLGTYLGFQIATITTETGNYPVSFASREKRLSFFASIKSYKPDVRIYRAF